jgi:hypothetical protein
LQSSRGSLEHQLTQGMGVAAVALFNRAIKNLEDSVAANKVQNSDYEQLADMYVRISDGYSNAPVLRLSWFRSLAAVHRGAGNHAEAAQCSLLSATYLAKYRRHAIPEHPKLLPFPVFPEVTCDVTLGSDPNHQEIQFTGKHLVETLRQAIADFVAAELYEYALEAHKLLLSIHEQAKDHAAAAQSHRDCAALFEDIVKAQESKARFLGMYYRVGFYGKGFDAENLHGAEFIYKEPKLTRLADICDRLKNMYDDKFSTDVVLIGESKRIDPATLNPEKSYSE